MKEKTLEQILEEQVIANLEKEMDEKFNGEVPRWLGLEQLKSSLSLLERTKLIIVNAYDKQIAAYQERIVELEAAQSEYNEKMEQLKKEYQTYKETHPDAPDMDW